MYSLRLFYSKILFFCEHLLGVELFLKLSGKKKNDNDSKIAQNRKGKGSYKIEDQLSPAGTEIILFKGIASHWEAVRNWDLNYFKEKFGNHMITINNNPGLVADNVVTKTEHLKLSEYIQQVQQGDLKYLKLSSLVHDEPQLKNQLDYNVLKNFQPFLSTGETYYTFIGGKGSITPMHNEIPCNVYVQIHGRKRWVLYPPDDFTLLGTHAERRPYFFTNANPDFQEDEKYPFLKYAGKIEIIIEPGDILYVPPFYWHYVENITDSISVAYKFANVPLSLRVSKFFTLMFFMATKPSIFTSFFVKRVKNKDYILDEKHSR